MPNRIVRYGIRDVRFGWIRFAFRGSGFYGIGGDGYDERYGDWELLFFRGIELGPVFGGWSGRRLSFLSDVAFVFRFRGAFYWYRFGGGGIVIDNELVRGG